MAVTSETPEVVCTPSTGAEFILPDPALADAYDLRIGQNRAVNERIADAIQETGGRG
jgi:hypothetical protein